MFKLEGCNLNTLFIFACEWHGISGSLVELAQLGACQRLRNAQLMQEVRRARDSAISEHTPFGPLHETIQVPCKSGTSFDLEVQKACAIGPPTYLGRVSFSSLVA